MLYFIKPSAFDPSCTHNTSWLHMDEWMNNMYATAGASTIWFCQYLILLLCNTSNACLNIDSTVLEMPRTLLSWKLRHRPWWCWRCLLWNENDTMLTFKMIIVDGKILIIITCTKTFCNFNFQQRQLQIEGAEVWLLSIFYSS